MGYVLNVAMMNDQLLTVVQGPYKQFLRQHGFIKDSSQDIAAEYRDQIVQYSSPDFRIRFVYDRGDVLTYLGPANLDEFADLSYLVAYLDGSEATIPANLHKEEVVALQRNYEKIGGLLRDPSPAEWNDIKHKISELSERFVRKLIEDEQRKRDERRPWWKFW